MSEEKIDTNILRKIPIFSALTDEELTQVMNAPENGISEYGTKEIIIKESEVGDCMYIVLDGAVEVSIRGAGGGLGRDITIATLREGAFFGEQSLTITDATGRRNATVRSLHNAKLFKVDKKYVRLTLKGGFEGSEDLTEPRSAPQDGEIRNLMRGMRLFESLKESELDTVSTWTEVIEVGPGDFVVKESEKGDCLYVILDGKVEIFTMDDDGKISIQGILQLGDYFGEQALLPGSSGKRNAYARTDDKSKLVKVPKAYFRLILNRDSSLAPALSDIAESRKE